MNGFERALVCKSPSFMLPPSVSMEASCVVQTSSGKNRRYWRTANMHFETLQPWPMLCSSQCKEGSLRCLLTSGSVPISEMYVAVAMFITIFLGFYFLFFCHYVPLHSLMFSSSDHHPLFPITCRCFVIELIAFIGSRSLFSYH